MRALKGYRPIYSDLSSWMLNELESIFIRSTLTMGLPSINTLSGFEFSMSSVPVLYRRPLLAGYCRLVYVSNRPEAVIEFSAQLQYSHNQVE